MNLWIALLIIEIIPILMWIVGGVCESKALNFKNQGIGYRSKFSGKNKYTWEYANKMVAKVAGGIGTLLFIINAIVIMMFGLATLIILLAINLLCGFLAILIVEKSLKKKFDASGKIKNN